MAIAEDAASVLEQFVQDVANLPAEINHLLEEIHAKDKAILDCRNTISSRDNSIQKFIKLNGASQANPKEEAYNKTILANLDKAQTIQNEKVTLSEKANQLLERQIKRLDLKIRDLQSEGTLLDPTLPSLLSSTTRSHPLSAPLTTSHPLNPLSANIVTPSTTLANAPITRLVHPTTRLPSPSIPPTTASPHPLSITTTPASHEDSKRRRLPTHLTTQRQTSLTPTLKPGGTTPRNPSPRPKKPTSRTNPPPQKTAPHNRISTLNPTAQRVRPSSTSRRHHKKSHNALRPSPSETGSENAMSEVEDSAHGDADVEMGEEGDGDDEKRYCVCGSVSYGNMVACENDECPYEWFHYGCVGLTKEPPGLWYCPQCEARR